jgi:hypothetical protein
MEPSPRTGAKRTHRRRPVGRQQRKRNGALAVAVILLATGGLTVFAGSNVLCVAATTGVGFCTSTAGAAATAGGGGGSGGSGTAPPAPGLPAPSPESLPWSPGPSNRLNLSARPGSDPGLGPAPDPIPPPPRRSAPGLPLVFVPTSINDSVLAALDGPLRTFLRSGDTIMLSSGADANRSPADVGYLNGRLSILTSELPSGLIYEARTGGLANVESIVSGLSSGFSAVVYDYEPGFESEFSLNFTSTLTNFIVFAQECHLAGFQAVGYPFSLPLWGKNFQQYNWDYGTLLASSGVDGIQLQDQGAIHTGMTVWNRSISDLSSQYHQYRIPADDMSLQLTLANGTPNQINVSAAYDAYADAVSRGVGQIILFWNLGCLPELVHFLRMIRA